MNVSTGQGPWVGRIDDFALRHGLSCREKQILMLVAQGTHPKAVAGLVGCAYPTVRTHLRRTYRKVGCSGNQELLALLLADISR
jgi:DNA-binding CsgD family transcriptional regulator